MRLKKMGNGFYFEPSTGDQNEQIEKWAESGVPVTIVRAKTEPASCSPRVPPDQHTGDAA